MFRSSAEGPTATLPMPYSFSDIAKSPTATLPSPESFEFRAL
jgi:hypothetical protein